MQNKSEDDISQLQAENEALKAELEESRKTVEALEVKANSYKRIIDIEKALFNRTSRFGLSIFIGSSLEKSIKAWLQAVKSDNLLPIEETANVAAAVIRRMLGNRLLILLGSLVGFITIFLLIWQNSLIQRQINQQAEQTTIARRAQLISILYDRDCSLMLVQQNAQPENLKDDETIIQSIQECPPKADARSRAEAAKAFVNIEKANGVEIPNLSNALLQGTNLNDFDLSSIDFSLANLSDVRLSRANLSFANFRLAKLSGAILRAANLSFANFSNVNLDNIDLNSTNLSNADFFGSSLIKANLGDAILTNTSIAHANLSNAHIFDANLNGAVMVGTNLSNANLNSATLTGAYLAGANLSGAFLTGADLNNVNFTDKTIYSDTGWIHIIDGPNFPPIYTDETIWPLDFDPNAIQAINCSKEPSHDGCIYWNERQKR